MNDLEPLAASASAEAALLCDALGVEASALRAIGREPLGDGTVAGFEVAAEGQSLTVYVDTSGIAVAAETGLVQPGVGRVWTHPADPHLPALAATAFGDAAQTLLGRLGLTGVALPDFVGYRPGRRAVLRVRTANGSIWIKVVRPRHAERIAEAHATLRRAGLPVPAVRAWSPDGLIILEEAAGTPATDAAWTASGLIDAVDDLRTRLDAVEIAVASRSAALTRVQWYAERLSHSVPALAARVQALRTALSCTPDSTLTTVHGDLHYGQLFLGESSSEIVGLIDVDTLGRGDRAEDAAAFLSHAIASMEISATPQSSRRLAELIAEATTRWGGEAAVRGRVAAHLLGHAAAAVERGERDRGLRLFAAAETWGDVPVPSVS